MACCARSESRDPGGVSRSVAAVARGVTFQNISKIASVVTNLDRQIDLAGALKRPYRRREESSYQTLDRVLEMRHELFHRNALAIHYTVEDAERDVASVGVALGRVYTHITTGNGWKSSP